MWLGRKRRLKERIKNPTTLGVKTMAKVIYRGNEYDTTEYRKAVLEEAAQNRNHDLMYRGLKVTKKVALVS